MNRDWSPQNEAAPTLRDQFAVNEHTIPAFTNAQAEEFLGIMPGTWNITKHFAPLLAKWKYQVADAMLREGGYS